MKISIKPEVFEKIHSQFRAAFILAEKIDNQSKLPEVNHLLKEVEKVILLSFNKETPKSHLLLSPWTIAKQEFGKKAKHYHTSVEQLLKKVLGHKSIEAKDTATAITRYLSLKHIVPVSVDDVKKIEGELTFAIQKKDLYYHDAKKVLGTKLDYWKNAKTVPSPSSRAVLLHFEFLPPISAEKQKEIVDEAADLLQTLCGGKVKAVVLSKKKSSASI